MNIEIFKCLIGVSILGSQCNMGVSLGIAELKLSGLTWSQPISGVNLR